MHDIRMKSISHRSNIIGTIHRLQTEYWRCHGNRPNTVHMNYDTCEFLKHECCVIDHHINRDSNDNNYIFGMKIEINNLMSDFEIMVEREEIIGMRNCRGDILRADFMCDPFRTKDTDIRKPKRYIINKGATILFWEDGTKTIVKRSKDDEYNKRLGFLTAYFQKHSGLTKNQANKYLANLQDEEELANE